ncbi:MAG: hypothetical protein IJX97_00140 [Clostridia bacterium]|nr:hypothetical protein [Clostridia bacterium]
MENTIFKIIRIEGEYAYLTPENGGEEVFIAMALLPLGADIGTRLICRDFQFCEAE